MLEGRALGDWKVIQRLALDGSTGGSFSVGYSVQREDGTSGFCKAMNYAKYFAEAGSSPDAILEAIGLYVLERDLSYLCGQYGMSKIIVALDDGTIMIDECRIPRVDYIIFELAQPDIRRQLNHEPDLQAPLRLRILHHVAVALNQLHSHHIAHQDIKPSNVLPCIELGDKKVTKLGDLGRASVLDRPANHDRYAIPGDRNYAPPEHLYGMIHSDFATRRFASDLYQLGCLATFIFTGQTMNSLLFAELPPDYFWRNWQGTYPEVLPYLQSAYATVIENMRARLPVLADELTLMIQCLCEPNPALRGHPGNRRGVVGMYDLQRVISLLDRLACAAESAHLAKL